MSSSLFNGRIRFNIKSVNIINIFIYIDHNDEYILFLKKN